MKLCIDCKFHVLEPNNLYPHRCKHPSLISQRSISPVTGLEVTNLADCEIERGQSRMWGFCNKSGALFEPKEPDSDIITWVSGVGVVLGEANHD